MFPVRSLEKLYDCASKLLSFLAATVVLQSSIACLCFSWYVRFHMLTPSVSGYIYVYRYLSGLLFTTLVWVIAAERCGVCRVEELFRERTGIRAASRAWFTTYALVLCVLFFFKSEETSRVFLALQAIALLGGTLVVHAALRYVIFGRRNRSRHTKRVLVIGADAFARRAAARLRHSPVFGCSIVGFVQLPDQEVKVQETAVYQPSDIEHLEIPIDDIVIAVPLDKSDLIPKIVRQFEPLCIPMRAIINLGDLQIRDRIFDVGRLQMLDLTTTPADTPSLYIGKKNIRPAVFQHGTRCDLASDGYFRDCDKDFFPRPHNLQTKARRLERAAFRNVQIPHDESVATL